MCDNIKYDIVSRHGRRKHVSLIIKPSAINLKKKETK